MSKKEGGVYNSVVFVQLGKFLCGTLCNSPARPFKRVLLKGTQRKRGSFSKRILNIYWQSSI